MLRYCLVGVLFTLAAFGQDNSQITQNDVITGKMFINFGTRTNPDTTNTLRPGSPKLGARDTYFFTLSVMNTVEFDGKIARQPSLFNKNGKDRVQPALFDFEKLDINVINPKNPEQKKSIGRWTGLVPIDTTTGAYKLAGIGERPLRIYVEPIGRALAINEAFAGVIFGKADDKANLQAQTYKRVIGDKTYEYTASKIDPLRFENVELATGPVVNYPRATVNGRLDYDYEVGNYITDGLKFDYNYDGKPVSDTVTGTIKWVDPKGAEKGYYEFNLRFNEAALKAAGGQGVDAAFNPGEGTDAFFAVDDNIPTLTGRIVYTDKVVDNVTIESGLVFNLNANKLTQQQLMNFAKLWILIVGPTNDE